MPCFFIVLEGFKLVLVVFYFLEESENICEVFCLVLDFLLDVLVMGIEIPVEISKVDKLQIFFLFFFENDARGLANGCCSLAESDLFLVFILLVLIVYNK